jgi:hypothetical protein
MKAIAASIVVLAGAYLFGMGNGSPRNSDIVSAIGIALGLLGLGLLAASWRDKG